MHLEKSVPPYKVNHQFIVVDIKQKLALLCSSLGKALNLQKVLQLDVILFGLGNFGALLWSDRPAAQLLPVTTQREENFFYTMSR